MREPVSTLFLWIKNCRMRHPFAFIRHWCLWNCDPAFFHALQLRGVSECKLQSHSILWECIIAMEVSVATGYKLYTWPYNKHPLHRAQRHEGWTRLASQWLRWSPWGKSYRWTSRQIKQRNKGYFVPSLYTVPCQKWVYFSEVPFTYVYLSMCKKINCLTSTQQIALILYR